MKHEDELQETLEFSKSSLKSFSKSNPKQQLFSMIIEKCIQQTESALVPKEGFSLQSACSAMRYNLEALIMVTLCKQNERNTIALLHKREVLVQKQTEVKIKQIEHELKIVEKYRAEEDAINKVSGISMSQIDQKRDELMSKFKRELVHLCSQKIDENGFVFTIFHFKEVVLPKLHSNVQAIKDRRKSANLRFKKDLLHSLAFKLKGNESDNEIEKKIAVEGNNKWEAKAKLANLAHEYEFVYSYTSSIIHCVTYSYITNPEVSEFELGFVKSATAKYLRLSTERALECCQDMNVMFL